MIVLELLCLIHVIFEKETCVMKLFYEGEHKDREMFLPKHL